MARKKPISERQRSVKKIRLLCGLVLAAVCTPGLAQEPEPTVTNKFIEPVVKRDEEQIPQPELTAEGMDAENPDEETLAAGETALDLVARLETEIMLGDLLADELYDEAVIVAERIAEIIEKEQGESLDLGVALSNLAIIQRRVRLYEESEANFVRAIDTIRSIDGIYSESVITPLVGLGINYRMRGDSFEAVAVFEEARTVSRRVLGLLNEEQVEIMDHLSSTLLDMQRYGEADRLQLEALQLRERIYGTDSIEVLPAIYKFASWLRAAFRFEQERAQYSRVMKVIRDNDLDDSPEMIRALREMGNSFRAQKFPEGRGISALRRALEIAEALPEPDPIQIAELLLDIGDWNIAFSKVDPTGDEYRRAWDLLDSVENGDQLRHDWFDNPDYVLRENPSNRGITNANEDGALPGNVLVRFDVTEHGRTENVRVVESVPPRLKDISTERAIKRSRFRPRMVDGEPVVSEGLARNFTFYYLPRE